MTQAVKPGTDAPRRSWHWLQAEQDEPEIMFWGMRKRWAAVGDPVQYTPAELAAAGYRYLCPVRSLSETGAAS